MLTRVRVLAADGSGAQVRDELTGRTGAIHARAVINATGVWSGDLDPSVRLRPSRGSHLVLRAAALGDPSVALTVPVPAESNRYVLVLPQPDGLVYVGLTDEEHEGPLPDVPRATEAEVGFLLDVLGAAFERSVGREDVVGTYSGMRPLLEAEGRPADLSRRHAVLTSSTGLVTVTGGKLTTYRRMAEDAVDAALVASGLDAAPCRTEHLPLVGAADRAQLARIEAPDRLVRRYGTEAPYLAALPQPATPVADGIAVTRAELAFGVSHEGALDAGDLLDRRTRLGLVPVDRKLAEAAAADALSAVLTA